MELTIIVCTLPERRRLLSRCLFYLEQQTAPIGRAFNTLIMHGAKPKGDKLNLAFQRVNTSHLMMVDDDDWISPVLVEHVIDHDVDFVGYNALQTADGRFSTIIEQEVASHICPLRTELARSEHFGNEYLSDIKWTKAIAPRVESNVHLDEILYFYDKWNPTSGPTGWSPPREVGPWPHDKSLHAWL